MSISSEWNVAYFKWVRSLAYCKSDSLVLSSYQMVIDLSHTNIGTCGRPYGWCLGSPPSLPYSSPVSLSLLPPRYRVAPTVKTHNAWGIGVYCFFRDHNVTVKSGIVCPPALEASFVHPLSVFLNGNGGITHIINDQGAGSAMGGDSPVHYVCD